MGQSDYAAANEILNKLAHWLDRRWPGRVVSLIWGPWSGVGMVSQLESHLGSRGLGMISPEAGGSLLVDELRHGRKGDVEVIYSGELGTLEQPILGEVGSRAGGGGLMRRGRPYEIAIDRHGLPLRRRTRPERVFREHRGGQGLHAGGAARSLGRRDVLRPRLAGQRSRSLVPGRLPGFAPPVRRGRARNHAADRRRGRARAIPGAGRDRGRAGGCRARARFARRQDRVEVVIGRGNYFNRGNLTRLQHGRMIAQTLSILAALHPDGPRPTGKPSAPISAASLPPFEAATIPGQLTNATAGRLAHRLDLSGASFVVDAASASSLVARRPGGPGALRETGRPRHRRRRLPRGRRRFPPGLSPAQRPVSLGDARPFAADADGMLPGEGVGVVVLKRRADAERDGDRIYAVIQGVGLASDGKSQGLAAPSARGHARAIRRAYRQAGIDPATVMLVEGHGLGVPAADRAELRALNAVFPRLAHGRRTLGAVSSMIGHAMPAAGMAGLIKTALALYHRVLPPTLHAEKPHPLLERSRRARSP